MHAFDSFFFWTLNEERFKVKSVEKACSLSQLSWERIISLIFSFSLSSLTIETKGSRYRFLPVLSFTDLPDKTIQYNLDNSIDKENLISKCQVDKQTTRCTCWGGLEKVAKNEWERYRNVSFSAF